MSAQMIGFRTVVLQRPAAPAPSHGTLMFFQVNTVPIFFKGASEYLGFPASLLLCLSLLRFSLLRFLAAPLLIGVGGCACVPCC